MPVGKAVHRDSRSVRHGNFSLRDAPLQFGEGDQFARERASRHTGGAREAHLARARAGGGGAGGRGHRGPPRVGGGGPGAVGGGGGGKWGLSAFTVSCPASVEEPGPQLAQAPQPGISISAPACSNTGSMFFSSQYRFTSSLD